jgi:DNA-binding transcriptional MerR regulator
MAKVEWIEEKEAARLVNRKPRTLRVYVKSGKWPVAYSALNNRRYHYDLRGIEKLMLQHSSAL